MGTKSSRRRAIEQKQVDQFISSSVRSKVDVLTLSTLPSSVLESKRPVDIRDVQWRDSCRWIIHSILTLIQQNRFKDESFVSLSSVALKNILGNDYTRYIRSLIDAQILECDGHYSITLSESLGYRIHEKYLTGKIDHRTITERKIIEAIVKHRKKKARDTRDRSKPMLPFTRWLIKESLTFDREAASRFFLAYDKALRRELERRDLKPSFKQRVVPFLDIRRKLMESTISNWSITQTFSIDTKGGRLYNALTNMSSILRNFVQTEAGEGLVSIDIKNSQPFHMLFTLRRDFWLNRSKGITLYGLDRPLFAHIRRLPKSQSPLIMFPNSAETPIGTDFYDSRFYELIVEGKLYEFIGAQFRGRFITKKGIDRFATRELTKREFMHMMYYDPQKINPSISSVFNAFKDLFPQVARLMEMLKRRDYRDFPILLQRIEVKMLLETVGRAIYEADPTIPLYSIHDSLVTTETHMPLVREILEQEYKRVLGVCPRLEEKFWSKDTAHFDLHDYIKHKIDAAGIDLGVKEPMSHSPSDPNGFGHFIHNPHLLPFFPLYEPPTGNAMADFENPFVRKLKLDLVD